MSVDLKIQSYRTLDKLIFLLIIVGLYSGRLTAQSEVEILKITTDDYSQFIGEKVSESKEEILLVLQNTQDTISLKKNLIKETLILNKKNTKVIEALRDDKFEKIQLWNGTVFRGRTISDNDGYIEFDAHNLSDTFSVDKNHISKYINKNDYFIFSNDKFHKKHGSINSIRMLFVSNIENNLLQIEILRYKLINPNQAIGVGIGFLTGSIDFDEVSFTELFLYSKRFLTNNRKRLFFETKIGAAIQYEDDSVFEQRNYDVYSSGPQLQYAIGIDYANSKDHKWSIYLGHLLQFTNNVSQTTLSQGVINRDINKLINSLTMGLSFNF